MTDPILDLLGAIGVPLRESRASLAARFGVRKHPAYDWNVVDIPTAPPLVEGLIYPLSFQVFEQNSPHMPATRLSCEASIGDDARRNIRVVAEQLAKRLGATEVAPQHNTMHAEWVGPVAVLRLLSWPPDMQSGRLTNSAHDRDPRLVTACHIAIETGFRPALTQIEVAWLASFVPVGPAAPGRGGEPLQRGTEAPITQLEFLREPPADISRVAGRVGISADREALIFCHSQLFVVPLARVLRFQIDRLERARGAGGAWLRAECATDYDGLASKTLTISHAPGMDDLNALGHALAAATGKRCKISDPDADA